MSEYSSEATSDDDYEYDDKLILKIDLSNAAFDQAILTARKRTTTSNFPSKLSCEQEHHSILACTVHQGTDAANLRVITRSRTQDNTSGMKTAAQERWMSVCYTVRK